MALVLNLIQLYFGKNIIDLISQSDEQVSNNKKYRWFEKTYRSKIHTYRLIICSC